MIEIGRKVSGRYHIIGNIGSGGMAHVFLAHDLILDRDVAIKVLRFDFQEDQVAIRRFQREALASTELVHPNIVSVYDVGEEDGLQYLVMEYVKGMDLKKYINTYYPIPYPKIVDICEQILSAVSLAHDHRIIHRDLKPQNILMDETGEVKIADFGIAIALSETALTQTNTMLGSVHYLSPEQARGSMATNQSDIYAVGVILYELLTGRVPFDGESAVTIALKHFQEEIPSVRLFDTNIPQSLENVVLHATTKDPINRYQTAEEMSADLYTALSTNRLNEAKWEPSGLLGETKVLTPITNEIPKVDAAENTPETAKSEKDATDKKKTKKQKRKKRLILGGIVCVIAIIGFFYLVGSQTPPDVLVPDVSNQTAAQAKKLLQEAGLTVASTTKEISDDTIAEGKVVKTNPANGASVKKGREVELYLSSGSKKIKMDEYVGETYADAVKDLKEKGFDEKKQITVKEETSENVEKGHVISQTPTAGSEIDPKSGSVTLVVSQGSATVYLPDFVSLGYTYDEAVNELSQLGISTKQITRVDQKSNVASGYILTQNPAAGTVDPTKVRVTLTVSTGMPEITIDRSYVGDTFTNAVNGLTRLGLSSNQISRVEVTSNMPEGTVISQSPEKGSSLDANTGVVTLTVSKGKEQELVTVPDLYGVSAAEAKKKLENVGLVYQASTENTIGKVVTGTSSSAGTRIAKGEVIVVYFDSPSSNGDGPNE